MHSVIDLKDAVSRFWHATPCGTRGLKQAEGSREFFEQLEHERYSREPFIARFAQFDRWKEAQVLEVGVGAGTDFVRFARAGAVLSGIDLTEHAVDLVKRRLELEHLCANIQQADAERLPFRDERFDFVYSWGVIHHTEDPERAVQEMMRVTKRGGRVCVMVYHRYSLVALQCWILQGLLRGRPWRSLSDCVWHHIESIGTKAYSIPEARRMFSCLTNLTVTPIVTPYDVRITRSVYLPPWVQSLIPSRLGWFLVVEGQKL
jgi:SAM-dependent methyltransferase